MSLFVRNRSSNSDDIMRKNKRAGSLWLGIRSSHQVKLLQKRIRSISESVKNYGYGDQIEDYKNMPIYLIQAITSSLSLSLFSEWIDPTYTIAAINILIWNGWKMAREDPQLLRFMTDNFLLHQLPSKNFRPRQVLLHGFSHIDEAHLCTNLACLLATGPLVRKYTDWSSFSYTSFYVSSLYISSLFNEVVYLPLTKTDGPSNNRLFRWCLRRSKASLGASGAVSAVLTFCGLACPHEKIELEKIEISDQSDVEAEPMWIIALAAFLSDIIMPLMKQSNIAHGAHIGGSIFGVLVYTVNHLWGAKLKECLVRVTSFITDLPPVRIFLKISTFVGKCFRAIYAGISSIPWIEIFLIAAALVIEYDGDEEEHLQE